MYNVSLYIMHPTCLTRNSQDVRSEPTIFHPLLLRLDVQRIFQPRFTLHASLVCIRIRFPAYNDVTPRAHRQGYAVQEIVAAQ
jgi:hypothetical protein